MAAYQVAQAVVDVLVAAFLLCNSSRLPVPLLDIVLHQGSWGLLTGAQHRSLLQRSTEWSACKTMAAVLLQASTKSRAC